MKKFLLKLLTPLNCLVLALVIYSIVHVPAGTQEAKGVKTFGVIICALGIALASFATRWIKDKTTWWIVQIAATVFFIYSLLSEGVVSL
ncbi:MAG TPA: hypothetical protein VK167_09970 [Flavipsychrobacter sp.]|nr:hypothetical protein [Flavipsychrobacter sp.]